MLNMGCWVLGEWKNGSVNKKGMKVGMCVSKSKGWGKEPIKKVHLVTVGLVEG